MIKHLLLLSPSQVEDRLPRLCKGVVEFMLSCLMGIFGTSQPVALELSRQQIWQTLN